MSVKKKDFGPDFVTSVKFTYIMEGTCCSVINEIRIILSVCHNPQTYKEEVASRDAAFRREAINNKMDLIRSNNTWVSVDLTSESTVDANGHLEENMVQMELFKPSTLS